MWAPGSCPVLVATVPVPDAWHESYLTPAVSGGLVLAAGGPAPGAGLVALVALDVVAAAERFRVSLPPAARGGEGSQVGLPRLLPDERILLPVYRWEESLTVYLIGADGRILREDDLAAGREVELDVYGADVGVKLWQEPLVVGAGAYLASWVYRARSWHLQCRDLATGAARWEAPERVLAVAGDVAVTETEPDGPGAGGAIVGRAVADGAERWRLPPAPIFPERARSFGAVVGDSLVLVDRGRRFAAAAQREEAIVARALELDVEPDRIDFDDLARAWEREHPPPGEDLVGYDLAGGHERWRYPVDGAVVSVAAGPAGVFAVTVDAARHCRLERIRLDGQRGYRAEPVAVDIDGPPAIAHVDDVHLLLAGATELVCVPTHAPRTVVWRLPLPDSPLVPRPNPGDRRILAASIAVTQRRVAVRGFDAIRVFAA
ncbi:hypothetical protein KZZ52_19875 [Dactylosporangium sp. AC04546]|uniref:hypothetical protein n=1 Tax=Dactylosporangium sp. AC04546 TaxID=2862460 RepID=UPI001EDDF937|nr:hypothetical protein [Dactylosporangium sp. AC04546]WVK87557.1 hypothetical protein KZZ52_19875 [Dactylosporangium sp. AC04546]